VRRIDGWVIASVIFATIFLILAARACEDDADAAPVIPVAHAESAMKIHARGFLARNGWHREEYFLTVQCSRVKATRTFTCYTKATAHEYPTIMNCDWRMAANRVARPRVWRFRILGCIA
jgi:hypothetical protein